MKKRLKTLLITIQLIMAIMFTAYILSPLEIQAQTTPKITLEPTLYQAQKIGETFNITARISDLEATDETIGIQFRVTYNDTILEALGATEGSFLQQFNNTVDPPYTFFMNFIDNDPRHGPNVLVGILLIPNATGHWTNFPEGNGILATITFKAIYRAVEPVTATCPLNLTNTLIADENDTLTGVEHTTEGATYEALPLPKPNLTVQPSLYTASLIGEIFEIDVNIENLDSDWKTVGTKFRLQYNDTILEAVGATEGSFLQQFNNTVDPPYTFFINFIEDDPRHGPNVLVGILLSPNATGHWTNFPEGNGTLATITFKSISQTGEPDPPASSTLILNDTQLITDEVNEIPHTLTDGNYEIEPLSFSYEPSIPIAGQPTFFKAPEANYTVTYCWNFGDGTSSNVTEPTVGHIYAMTGKYDVTLTCVTDSLTATVTKTIDIWPHKPTMEVTIDVGSIHFGGEIAEFNILTTNYGEAINASKIEAFLYYNGILQNNLTSLVQPIDTGFYMIPYNIPVDAETGTYTLTVKAEYYNAKGIGMKSFQISQTLRNWDNSITQIQGDIATILVNLNYIKLNLTAINATLMDIQGDIAIIDSEIGLLETNLSDINATLVDVIVNSKDELVAEIATALGTVQTNLENIESTITDIDGDTAWIRTHLGDVELELGNVQGTATTTLYTTSILSAIAAILAAIILMILRKR